MAILAPYNVIMMMAVARSYPARRDTPLPTSFGTMAHLGHRSGVLSIAPWDAVAFALAGKMALVVGARVLAVPKWDGDVL